MTHQEESNWSARSLNSSLDRCCSRCPELSQWRPLRCATQLAPVALGRRGGVVAGRRRDLLTGVVEEGVLEVKRVGGLDPWNLVTQAQCQYRSFA